YAVQMGLALEMALGAGTIRLEPPVASPAATRATSVPISSFSAPAYRTYRNVELIDSRANPIGEFDKVENGLFVEYKKGTGLDVIPPGRTTPEQTPAQWAERDIFDRTSRRIESLQTAVGTRPRKDGTPTVPTIDEIRGVTSLEFRIESKS